MKKLALALFATLLTLAAAEGVLRARGHGAVVGIEANRSDPVLVYTQGPSDDAPWQQHFPRATVGQDIADTPSPDRPRIVAVGDSFTFGLEIEAQEAWPHQLRDHLDAETINLGTFGYNACQVDRATERFALPLQPDVLVVGVFTNDGERTSWNPPQCGACLPDCSVGERISEVLVHNTRLGLVVAHAARARRFGDHAPEAYLHEGRPQRMLEASLTRLVERARAQQVPVLAVLFDAPGAPETHAGNRAWCERTEALFAALDVPTIDVHTLLTPDQHQGWRARDGRHFDARANAVVAQAVAAKIRTMPLAPR